ncbi:MAG: hypothetical protein GX591_02665 [Planctomycetes bacterium]|nr:hypothetical protein [Planctomycetota bacterium]
MAGRTVVSIEGDAFLINGTPTYPGRVYQGMNLEGLLMNSRMVQGTFDDTEPTTRGYWDYADGPWDAERNVREFLAAMDEWRAHGLLSFTLNLQGGSPQGYSRIKEQTWCNSAFEADGSLKEAYLDRLGRILDKADDLGMAPILGYFYFGQDWRLTDDAAVSRAARNATDWLIERGDRNVLIEIANEANIHYRRDIIKAPRVHELIRLVADHSAGRVDSPAGRLLVSASMGGGTVPPANVIAAGDFILLHGNGVGDPNRIRAMVDQTRAAEAYRGQPIVFNEDDHFDFDKSDNNMVAAVSRHASWGYFDYRFAGEGFDEGYQSVPVNWSISSDRKRGFFGLLKKMTGA